MPLMEEVVQLFRYLGLVSEADPEYCGELGRSNREQTFRLTRDGMVMYPSLLWGVAMLYAYSSTITKVLDNDDLSTLGRKEVLISSGTE